MRSRTLALQTWIRAVALGVALMVTACAREPSSESLPEIAPPPTPTVPAYRAPVEAPASSARLPEARSARTVAFLLPLQASSAALRQDAADLRDAAQMALFDLDGASGLSLLFLDSGGAPDGAALAAQEALTDGATAIIGPLLRESVPATAVVARPRGVPVLALSNDATLAGDGVWILGSAPELETRRILDYARGRGLTRFALLAPNNLYGQAVFRAFQRETAASVGKTAFYDPAATDFGDAIRAVVDYRTRNAALTQQRAALRRDGDTEALKQLERRQAWGAPPFDAVLIAAMDQNALRTLAAQLAQYDVAAPEVRLLGLSLWRGFGALSKEPPLLGAWYAAPPEGTWPQFSRRFQDYYGRAPSPLATLGYEAVILFSQQISQQNGTPGQTFAGVRGPFRFDADQVAERALAVWEVAAPPFVRDPAPDLQQGAAPTDVPAATPSLPPD